MEDILLTGQYLIFQYLVAFGVEIFYNETSSKKVLQGLALGKVYMSFIRFALKHQLLPIFYCLFGWSFSNCLEEKLCLRKVVGI